MKIGLIGCGGMGTTHNNAIKAISQKQDVEIVAIADCREEFLNKACGNWENARKYNTGMELIENENVDLVHICLPTYLHAEHAIKAMEKGINVFIEKPVCLTKEDCARLEEVQKKTNTTVMIGHVVRFFDEYSFLKNCYDNQTYGKLKSMTMQRLSGDVTWGFDDWFHDTKKSGSVVLDLHIHDADFLRFMLGEPEKIKVNSTKFPSGMVNHIITQYKYGDVIATAEGLWDVSSALPFEASFKAHFEDATVIFNSRKQETLQVYLKDGTLLTPKLDKEFEKVDNSAGINVSNLGPYYTEIKYFISCLQNKKEPDLAPLSEGIKSVNLTLKELELAENGTIDWVSYNS